MQTRSFIYLEHFSFDGGLEGSKAEFQENAKRLFRSERLFCDIYLEYKEGDSSLYLDFLGQ
jgi:hypothetical protein